MSAQRYASAVAKRRMDEGMCPECGEPAAQHSSDDRFWMRTGCSLMPHGVLDRIAQYCDDQTTADAS